MKIKINIDCTPEEARTFFGLPDVQPIQRAMMERFQAQMEKQMEQLDPTEIMKMWLTPGMEGISQFQKAMWSAATRGGSSSSSDDD
jgi:hypothetical protein